MMSGKRPGQAAEPPRHVFEEALAAFEETHVTAVRDDHVEELARDAASALGAEV